jgi:hypothetical protein
MKYLNYVVMNASDTASHTSDKIDSNQLIGASFHCIFGDSSVAGSVKIQASNDPAPTNYTAVYNFTPTNWVDIPSMSATVTAGAPVLITIPNTSLIYRWMRVVFTNVSGGSSTILVEMMAVSV